MKTTQLANAISMLDDNILDDILEERYERNLKLKSHGSQRASLRRFSLVASTVAVACFLAMILVPNFIGGPNTNNVLDTPQYIPAFSSPNLDALYKEHPYSEILPQKIPETLKFLSSYKTEYDPIANPNNEQYLALDFGSEQSNTSLEIKVIKYDGQGMIANPSDTDSFDLSRYYGYLETSGAVGADAPQLVGLFRSEDISSEIAEKRMYVFDDGLCKAEIEVLCGEYIISYNYVGAEISAQLFYDVISSSSFFK